MRIGDIKIEALKLMFTSYSFDITIDDLRTALNTENLHSALIDENFASYLVGMTGSINRGIDRIQNACVVPPKMYEVGTAGVVEGKNHNRFDLATIEDLYVIDRVTAESASGNYLGDIGYIQEGNTLLLDKEFSYTIIYYPTIRAVNDGDDEQDQMWLPEHLARLLPLYIKSELYQEEEPSLAADARNTFEMSLDDIKQNRYGRQNRIKRVLGL